MPARLSRLRPRHCRLPRSIPYSLSPTTPTCQRAGYVAAATSSSFFISPFTRHAQHYHHAAMLITLLRHANVCSRHCRLFVLMLPSPHACVALNMLNARHFHLRTRACHKHLIYLFTTFTTIHHSSCYLPFAARPCHCLPPPFRPFHCWRVITSRRINTTLIICRRALIPRHHTAPPTPSLLRAHHCPRTPCRITPSRH